MGGDTVERVEDRTAAAEAVDTAEVSLSLVAKETEVFGATVEEAMISGSF